MLLSTLTYTDHQWQSTGQSTVSPYRNKLEATKVFSRINLLFTVIDRRSARSRCSGRLARMLQYALGFGEGIWFVTSFTRRWLLRFVTRHQDQLSFHFPLSINIFSNNWLSLKACSRLLVDAWTTSLNSYIPCSKSMWIFYMTRMTRSLKRLKRQTML